MCTSVGKRAIEVDGGVGAVAERLVARVSTASECHLVGVVDLAIVAVGETYRAGDDMGPDWRPSRLIRQTNSLYNLHIQECCSSDPLTTSVPGVVWTAQPKRQGANGLC